MITSRTPTVHVAADNSRGIYSAQLIAQRYRLEPGPATAGTTGGPQDTTTALRAGPDHPAYEDCADWLLTDGVIVDVNGWRYWLEVGPSGDWLAVPCGMDRDGRYDEGARAITGQRR